MKTLKIIHAADLHLDSPFEAMGERAAERRAEQRTLLGRIAALTRERSADLLLLAGDLLDSELMYAETGDALCEALEQVDCPVFISPGNHDYDCAASPYRRLALPGNVHVFRPGPMQCVTLPELDVRVWGSGFGDISCPPRLREFSVEKQPGVLDVGVLHGKVGKATSPYNPISEAELAGSGLDYLALGHVHSYDGLQRAGNTWYAWPGCPEGRGFDECGEKGLLYVELSGDGCTAEFLPLEGRRYEILRFDPAGGMAGISIPARAKRDIYRIIFTGETDRPLNLQRYYELLKDRFYGLELVDDTRLSRNLWERAEQDTLRGLFLRKMRQLYDDAADEETREEITRAARWGLAALDGGEEAERL